AMEVDADGGRDLWEGRPLWVDLVEKGPKTWRGRVAESRIDGPGFREGDELEFDEDEVFQICRFDAEGMPIIDSDWAAWMQNKTVLAGITVLDSDGQVGERRQIHGRVE